MRGQRHPKDYENAQAMAAELLALIALFIAAAWAWGPLALGIAGIVVLVVA